MPDVMYYLFIALIVVGKSTLFCYYYIKNKSVVNSSSIPKFYDMVIVNLYTLVHLFYKLPPGLEKYLYLIYLQMMIFTFLADVTIKKIPERREKFMRQALNIIMAYMLICSIIKIAL